MQVGINIQAYRHTHTLNHCILWTFDCICVYVYVCIYVFLICNCFSLITVELIKGDLPASLKKKTENSGKPEKFVQISARINMSS